MHTKTTVRIKKNKKLITPNFWSSLREAYWVDLIRLVFFSSAIYMLLALWGYQAEAKTAASTGLLGTYIGKNLLQLLGLCAYAFAFSPSILVANHFLRKNKRNSVWLGVGVAASLLFTCILLNMMIPVLYLQGLRLAGGGLLGQSLDKSLHLYLGRLGVPLMMGFLATSASILIWQRRLSWPFQFRLAKEKFPRVTRANPRKDNAAPIGKYALENVFEGTKRSSFLSEEQKFSNSQTNQRSKDLLEALSSFAIEGEIIDVQIGPVVSTFAFKAIDGTRQAKIFSLSKDLALQLRVETLLVIQMPELQAIGFQIPNSNPQMILFGDLIRDESFLKLEEPLKFIIGRDVAGNVVSESLAKLPHLLIAGSTGSGKSIGIHCFICSLLVSPARQNLKLVLIDPKMLELAPYAGIPNLLHPVITDQNVALSVMEELVEEMNARYRMMAECKSRDILSFNKAWQSKTTQEKSRLIDRHPILNYQDLPYIVLIIDEYAELALMTNKKIELPLVQLAQKSRAAGIHIVLSTQRPSIDVITGLIKANFPARLSYKVASGIDSRTILNQLGAEKLLGKGDLLFYKPGDSHPKRCHGPYVDEKSIEKLVQILRNKE